MCHNEYMRYAFSLLTFLAIMAIVLSAYWLWHDFAADGFRDLTWSAGRESLADHFRIFWRELWLPCGSEGEQPC
jgi:hypothetical protein